MTTTITDYIDVRKKLSQLGLREAHSITLLPENFDAATALGELRQRSESATVKTLLRSAGLVIDDLYGDAKRPSYIQNNDATWVGPVLLITASAISGNANLISVALGVVSNYLTDYFKGRSGEPVVKLAVVVEQSRSRSWKRIEYQGPPGGLSTLAEVVRETVRDSKSA